MGEGAKRVTTAPFAVAWPPGSADPPAPLAPTGIFSKIGRMPPLRMRAPSIALWGLQKPLRALGRRLEEWIEAERDQLALWLPVALGLGIAAWFCLPERQGWIAVLLGGGGIALAGLALGRGSRAMRAAGLFGLAVSLGCALAWGRAVRLDHPVLARPTIVQLGGRIERVERLPSKGAIRLTLAMRQQGLPERVRVTVDAQAGLPGLGAGARVAMRARLVPPPPPLVPGGYDFARVAWFARIGATGSAMGPVTIVAAAAPGGWRERLAEARDALQRHILARLGAGGAGGIAAALAVGDQGAIGTEDQDAMRRSGLAHLLSVSGLHLTAVVGAAMFVTIRLLALWPWLALRMPLLLAGAGVGAIAGIAYTLLTGAEVPTLRSCIAALLVLVGIAIGRDALTLRLVAAGALILLLLWPESLIGPSFEMSFAAIASLIALHEERHVAAWFAPRDEGWPARVGRTAASLLLTGLVVEVALAPIALYHFHRAGLYGALANIVAIPLTTFVIMPAEAGALLLDLAGLGAPLWWLAGRALDLLLALAHHVAALPGAVGMLPAMPRGAFALMVGGGVWLALWRTRARLLGLLPFAAGMAWAAATAPADLLVSGDGRHLLLREESGRLALLRQRTGDYARSTLAEVMGADGAAPIAIDGLAGVRCGADACVARVHRGDRSWTILATRSPYRLDWAALGRSCAASDIVVSDRRLPRGCTPRWLRADAPLLRRIGGLAIDLRAGIVRSVADEQGTHPWAAALHAPPRRPYRRPAG